MTAPDQCCSNVRKFLPENVTAQKDVETHFARRKSLM